MSNVHAFQPRPRPRRVRLNTEKAVSAFGAFELSESALRQALATYLPFSGLMVTQAEAAELRQIADRISLIAARIESRIMPEGEQ